jgi:glycosyltransferase involved in cell wall biosynthesis
MTALLIAYYYPPENTSGSARPYRFARYLPGFGIQPVILAGGDGNRIQYQNTEENVFRIPTPAENNFRCRTLTSLATAIQRLALPYEEHVPWIPAAVQAGVRIARQTGAAAIYSTSPPIASHIVAWRIKKALGLRWVADFRDPIQGNPFRTSKRARWYDPRVERIIMDNADAVIANTSNMAEVWAARHPQHRHKVSVIWNGFDPMEEFPVSIERPERQSHLLTHVGSLYGYRHPGRLLQSIRRLVERKTISPDALTVRLVGPTERVLDPDFESTIESLRALGAVQTRLTQVPKQEATQEMTNSDGLLLLDLNERGTGVQVPAKLFEYVRMGKPILAFTARHSAVEHILERSGVPSVLMFNEDDDDTIDRKLCEYVALPGGQKREPSDWFLESFDGRRQTRTLSEILKGNAGI